MELKKFIKIYDDVIPIKALCNILRFANTCNFDVGKIDNDIVNTKIRSTKTKYLSNTSNSMTDVHWHNFLYKVFQEHLNKYKFDLNLINYKYDMIIDMGILKYEVSDHYDWHYDHFATVPRTMSCILLLNNDYENGNLYFRNPDGSDEMKIETVANRLIVWPSPFLFPHCVKPVTKGTRYSVVAWAL